MNAQKKDRQELEDLFKNICCPHICQDVLSSMKDNWIKDLIARSMYRSLVTYQNWDKRRAMTKIAEKTGLAFSAVEKKFYQKKEKQAVSAA